MSLVVIPESAVAEVDAPLVEWAVKVLMSIPDIFKTSFNHRAIVQGAIGLRGLTIATKR